MNPHDCPFLCNYVFDNFFLPEELFAEALRSFESCIIVNNKLSGKLFSSLEPRTAFHERFKVISVPFFYF